MTREEAKKWLNKLYARADITDEYGDMEDMKPYEEAINMAIKALEQEPCCDAISRQDAIRVASGYCHWSNIPDELAKLPSVNPIPCEDAISRQAAIDEIFSEPLYKTGLKKRYAEDAVPAIFEKIKALPSVSTGNPNRCGEDVTCTVTCAVTCTDAISRQAAIDAMATLDWQELYLPIQFKELLDELPYVSVKEKTGLWIPSERLPKDGIYLVTVERTTGKPRVEIKSFAKDLNRVDDFDFPEHKCGWYDYDSEYGYWEDTNVIAWMPLPQPYKGESEDKE